MAISEHRVFQSVEPGDLGPAFEAALAGLDGDAVVRRVWDRDWTVWKPEDREISNRLGWLDAPEAAVPDVPAMEAFAASLRGEGLDRAAVLGMGGSSLAPDVFARLFPAAPGSLALEVLDTTEPGAVAAAAARLDPGRTLFLVSSKSGSTAELVALLSFFYDRSVRALGRSEAGKRFVAVTDPGSPLEGLAGSLGFRRIFSGRPDIGGRFSALSAFGFLPAALMGIDLGRLLASARGTAAACRAEAAAENPGALLGAFLGAAARAGRDKLVLLVPPRLVPFAAWLEQLVAESTGKEGRGILPVVETDPEAAYGPGPGRVLVEIGSARADSGAGLPRLRLAFDDPYDLGGQSFLWEFATAVAGRVLGINPFDQPDVESTKRRTREVLAAGAGPAAGPLEAGDPGTGEALGRFLEGGRAGDYLAILAFLPPRPEVESGLAALRDRLASRTGLPVTIGFGPRYLHSTGQLHKGDANRGLFLLLTASGLPEVAIPELPGIARPARDFAGLFRAQARGDELALAEKGRRVLAVDLPEPVEDGLAALISSLK